MAKKIKTPARIDAKTGTITVNKKLFESSPMNGFVDVHEIGFLIKVEFKKLYNGKNYNEAYSTAEEIIKNRHPEQFENAMNWIARNKLKRSERK